MLFQKWYLHYQDKMTLAVTVITLVGEIMYNDNGITIWVPNLSLSKKKRRKAL